MMKGRSILGYLVSISALVFNALPAAAQSSERYPTNAEAQQAIQEFREQFVPAARRSREFDLGERDPRLDTFTNAWSKVDPTAASFLGRWDKGTSNTQIYPSYTKGRVCIILSVLIRGGTDGDMKISFTTGAVQNNQILIGSGLQGAIPSVYYKESFIRQGNYLGRVGIYKGKLNVNVYMGYSYLLIPPTQLRSNNQAQKAKIVRQFEAAGCTTSLPGSSQIAANQSPSTPRTYTDRGDARSRNGDKKGAIADYTEAIRLNPGFATAYYNRAIDRVAIGDKQGAIADFKKAAELFGNKGMRSDRQDALNEIAKLGGERSPSTGVAQTANSANCPKDQLPVVVKTSDGQSPSYAGSANAGVNKNGKRNDGSKIDPITRCIFFVEIQSPPNPYETWLISHGWDDSSKGSLKALAQAVAKQNPNDRVLMLDWSEASINKGDDGANPLGINEKLSRGNYYAATWIRPTAEVAFEYLKRKYQLDPSTAKSTLNMIGHSLGSLMSAEIGRLYKQSNGIGINYLVALDPPSEFNVLEGTPIGSLGGYDLDGRTPAYKDVRKPSATVSVSILLPPLKLTSPFETRTLVPGNVDRPQPFDSVARFSRAFVGKTSFAGNQAFAATAHESFQMDFGDRSDPLNPPSSLGREHGLVVESFTRRIAGEGFIPSFLGLRDRKRHEDIKSNAYPYRVNPLNPADVRYEYTHEGVITISRSNQFSAFHLESRSLGKIVFSSMDNATEDTTYLTLDMNIAGRRGSVAGGSFFPEVNKIWRC